MEASIAAILGDRYLPTGRLLGSGGMGRVLEARDQVLLRNVAVKILNRELAADSSVRSRFGHEATAAASLNHPNVVSVYDVGIGSDPPFIVMERLPGRTVADEIARGPMAAHVVRRIGLEVLAALDHAHRFGVVHRDIKPGNVLLDVDGTAKVADFGIAKSLGADLTRTRELLGTPCYLAPEILAGSPADPQTDVYATGVTLYEMIAGRKPFVSDTPWATLAAIQRGERPPLRTLVPDVDPILEEAIERAMAPDPSQRFRSAGEMADVLGSATLASAPVRLEAPIERIVDLDSLERSGPSAVPTDATRRLEHDPTTISLGRPAVPVPAPFWRRRFGILVGATLAGILLVVMLLAAAVSDDRPSRLGGIVGASDPTPGVEVAADQTLERALRELEEAVRP